MLSRLSVAWRLLPRTGKNVVGRCLGSSGSSAGLMPPPASDQNHHPINNTNFRRVPRRSVWSTGRSPPSPAHLHPLCSLTPEEIAATADSVKSFFAEGGTDSHSTSIRFVSINLNEPNKSVLQSAAAENGTKPPRKAEVLVLNTETGIASELDVDLQAKGDAVSAAVGNTKELPRGVQPLLTPDDCNLAEEIAKSSSEVQHALKERYGITDMARVAADPWSVHLACEADIALTEPDDPSMPPRRLVQTFLYQRVQGQGLEDNHYAHPIDILPVVDLNTETVVRVDGLDRLPPPEIPQLGVNYHRNLVKTNSYLQTEWRENALKALDITQPDGPSFTVDGNRVDWQNWSFTVGWNAREGLVLHKIHFDGRPVVNRLSLVEMAVPYGDPNPPYSRKCAFDVGDYGLGFCANSLELGCDCLGLIHYFDAALSDSNGDPYVVKKAICMHEEDDGILWKHVEYRNGHNESRRARELVISFICTVVNYEYLFYIRFKLNGEIEYEIRLSGELSTNLPSAGEDPDDPSHGVLCAPGVNSQVHQHMFCARIDMSVDGQKNTVSEVDVVAHPDPSLENPFGNIFGPVETILRSETDAVRTYDANRARTWKISNAEGKLNPITGKPTAYKLVPFTKGPAQPPLLTAANSSVSTKGEFATAHLWVTPYDESERYPAGEYTPQAKEQDGLPVWIKDNDNIEGEDVILWHAFGVTHVPTVENFPVMNCEITAFSLKPDGFNAGNPAIDLPPEINETSELDSGCCTSK